jgi:hypothetical protein
MLKPMAAAAPSVTMKREEKIRPMAPCSGAACSSQRRRGARRHWVGSRFTVYNYMEQLRRREQE